MSSHCRELILYSLVALPLRTILLPLVTFDWKAGCILLLCFVLRPVIYVLYFGFQRSLHSAFFVCFGLYTILLTSASFARLYEFEYLNRVSYQVMFFLCLLGAAAFIYDLIDVRD